jgi:hypothetical protein
LQALLPRRKISLQPVIGFGRFRPDSGLGGIVEVMSDRSLLFIGTLVMLMVCLGSRGALVATGQAATLDGLFLMSVCGVGALAFGLYLLFMINRAKEEIEQENKSAK